MVTIVLYLSQRRGQRDNRTRLIDSVSPPRLSEANDSQLDVRVNLSSAIELGLVASDGDIVRLTPEAKKAARGGSDDIAVSPPHSGTLS